MIDIRGLRRQIIGTANDTKEATYVKSSIFSLACLALGAVVLTGCGSTTATTTSEATSEAPAAGASSSAPAASTSAPASAPGGTSGSSTAAPSDSGTPECKNPDIKASFKALDNGAGHRFGQLVLTNVSGHPCRTGGFGGLSFVADNGAQIGAPATRTGQAAPIQLAPGQAATAQISETNPEMYDSSECRPRKVYGLRVYIPNETHWQDIPHATTGCANPKVGLIEEQPLRAQ